LFPYAHFAVGADLDRAAAGGRGHRQQGRVVGLAFEERARANFARQFMALPAIAGLAKRAHLGPVPVPVPVPVPLRHGLVRVIIYNVSILRGTFAAGQRW